MSACRDHRPQPQEVASIDHNKAKELSVLVSHKTKSKDLQADPFSHNIELTQTTKSTVSNYEVHQNLNPTVSDCSFIRQFASSSTLG
jgi:hypothetical protein